jgi:hypothetical protein
MPYSEPTTPPELPAQLVEQLDNCDVETLRAAANYAEALAECRERETRLHDADKDNAEGVDERPDDLPNDVPTKATLTVKEINDSQYYYWQWRDGEKIKSKYKGPVSQSE